MTVLDLLTKAAGAAGGLVTLLEKVKEKAPDLADEVDGVLAALAQAVEPGNLAQVGVSVVTEVRDVLTGKVDPRDHPSDGA